MRFPFFLAFFAVVTPRLPRPQVRRRVAGVILLAQLAWQFAGFASAADSPPRKAPPRLRDSAAALPNDWVEAVNAAAGPSVVVVSQYGRDGTVEGMGAGFVVSTNGLIATCLHVIGEGRALGVRFADGTRAEVNEIYAWDRKLDLAVIRVAGSTAAPLPLGDSDALKQGAPVVAIGNPQGLEHSVVQGVVSAMREFEETPMIQVAIPIEPGNSGGPLLDARGQVQGILTLKFTLAENLGFAMPVNALKPLLAKPNSVPIDRWLTIQPLDAKTWRPIMGARWTQKVGRIQVEGLGSGFGGRSLCLYKNTPPPEPYEVAVQVKLDDEAGAAGLAFAADGGDIHYGFYPSAGQLRLTRFDGPDVSTWTILEQVKSPAYRPGEWNALKVHVDKDRLVCSVNDQVVIESRDARLRGGKVGLAKFRQTRAVFKRFELGAALPPAGPPRELLATLSGVIRGITNAALPAPAALSRLAENAGASQPLLLERAKDLAEQAEQFRKLADLVRRQRAQTNLVEILSRPDSAVDLGRAALLVAELDGAEVDAAACEEELARMARDLSATTTASGDALVRLKALSDYLFTENGFHGSRADYYNRANSHLNEVLDNREGIPVTLSVLYMELGWRVGLTNLAGIPLPGHFIVGDLPKSGPARYIDVYEGGKLVDTNEIRALVQENTGERFQLGDLQPATKREIIVRMLNNLANIAMRSGTNERALTCLDTILALQPEAARERWSRALVRLQGGDSRGAKQDLQWLLDREPPGVDLERARQIFQSL